MTDNIIEIQHNNIPVTRTKNRLFKICNLDNFNMFFAIVFCILIYSSLFILPIVEIIMGKKYPNVKICSELSLPSVSTWLITFGSIKFFLLSPLFINNPLAENFYFRNRLIDIFICPYVCCWLFYLVWLIIGFIMFEKCNIKYPEELNITITSSLIISTVAIPFACCIFCSKHF